MATLAQSTTSPAASGNGGMEELLPLVKQLTDPDQVRLHYCEQIVRSLWLYDISTHSSSSTSGILERSRSVGAIKKERKLSRPCSYSLAFCRNRCSSASRDCVYLPVADAAHPHCARIQPRLQCASTSTVCCISCRYASAVLERTDSALSLPIPQYAVQIEAFRVPTSNFARSDRSAGQSRRQNRHLVLAFNGDYTVVSAHHGDWFRVEQDRSDIYCSEGSVGRDWLELCMRYCGALLCCFDCSRKHGSAVASPSIRPLAQACRTLLPSSRGPPSRTRSSQNLPTTVPQRQYVRSSSTQRSNGAEVVEPAPKHGGLCKYGREHGWS